MHGRVKVRTTAEQERIKQIEREKKAAEFKKGIELVFHKRKNQEWDNELLLVTEKLLVRFPDVYTLWNIRRETFLNNKWSNEERVKKLENELLVTETSLRENPKSYGAWHHRTWTIEQIPNPNWKKELDLCNKCLNLDERNFHCWDYRQFIVDKAHIPDEKELEFTTIKILNNFSNFSSWHYRSKLLQRLYPSNVHDLPIRADKHDEELDLVMNATFTDPNDSSAWFYQRWLLDYWKPPFKFWQAVVTKTTVIAAFHKEVSSNLEILLNDTKIQCKWKSANGKKFSFTWYAEFEKPFFTNIEEVSLRFEKNVYKFNSTNLLNEWVSKGEVLRDNHNNPKLNEQLENYQSLSKMEPSNKWAKSTSTHLMLNIDPIDRNSSIMNELNELMKIDLLRKNYYKDMRSICILKYNLNAIESNKNESDVIQSIDLSNMELTTLSSQEPYLTFYHEINISNNYLGERLHQFYTLQECIKLDLSNNSITSLKTFPTLRNLKVLLLSNNQITNSEEILDLLKKHNLIKLELNENSFTDKDSLVNDIKNISPNIEVTV